MPSLVPLHPTTPSGFLSGTVQPYQGFLQGSSNSMRGFLGCPTRTIQPYQGLYSNSAVLVICTTDTESLATGIFLPIYLRTCSGLPVLERFTIQASKGMERDESPHTVTQCWMIGTGRSTEFSREAQESQRAKCSFLMIYRYASCRATSLNPRPNQRSILLPVLY